MRYLDPTISNWSKAAAAGIDAQHAYETSVRFDMEEGDQAERLAVYASLKACVINGHMELDELPDWARAGMQYELATHQREEEIRVHDDEMRRVLGIEVAPAPAPVETRYSTHQERRMTRKRARAAEEQQQARERQRARSVDGLHRLVDAWGARVKGEIAPLRRG